ncbi:hypothetical protein F5Y13DRAFT_1037 [Hypoxylon sp. FL1857]|nr:hypothetical protein F5Y13DRAFT_1037 [Hypoxylon sp. FL1857]
METGTTDIMALPLGPELELRNIGSPQERDFLESGNSSDDSRVDQLEERAPSTSTPPSSAGGDDDSPTQRDECTNTITPGITWNRSESKAREDWEYQKSAWGESNDALDELMDMIGLEAVKRKFVQWNTLIQTAQRQGLDVSEKLGAVFIGNPGTGKSQVAKQYANFLYITDSVPDDTLTTITGSRLVASGVQGYTSLLDALKEDRNVLLIDDNKIVYVRRTYLLSLNTFDK